MFRKILIANRGEIAVRIIRACRSLGVDHVAIFSDADREALHVRLADEAWPCGPAPAGESYLDAARVIDIAQRAGADAVHPGYGFLSENAAFAEACARAGLVFIGPAPSVLRDMGDKITSRRAMDEAGVPIVPGTTDALSDDAARAVALEIGLPVMVKASAGGGGRGLRIVADEAELDAAIERARSEATAAFGDGALYIEKALDGPRHIEVQILADAHGHVLHLGERECSVQRRHQKLIEEAPANRLSDALRAALHAAAVAAARAVDYCGAGTVEFLVDAEGDFHFLEMNTRIQVEHPVTEAVTGVDLVAESIRVAAGEPLSFRQSDVVSSGHAIEARIYAEDPDKNFMPSPGRITHWRAPDGPGVRVDAGVEAGNDVPMHYDPMVAKLVVSAGSRDQALHRLRTALSEFVVGGIRTSIPFHLRALESEAFVRGEYDTGFVEAHLSAPLAVDAEAHAFAACVAGLELRALGHVSDGAPVQISRKGQADHEVSVSGSPDMAAETPPAVRLGDRLRSLDARRVSPGLWSVLEGGRQSEVVVELRGKSGIDVVTRGVRHALKWKLA
jgi:acetyl-CoA carboxylase biotin carboxylase subunit